jgi:hypothetical protein
MAPRRSWDKADNPYWRTHVGSWFRSSLEAEEYCRRHTLSTVTFELWARHLLTPKDMRKRAEYLRELREKKQKKRDGKVAPHAFWGMHVEGDELERHGARRVRGGARSFAARAAQMARPVRGIRHRNGLAIASSSECPSPIKQRCYLRAAQLPLDAWGLRKAARTGAA